MFFESNELSSDKVKPYLEEIKKIFNGLKFYFDNSDELTKSVSQFYLANIWFKYAKAEGINLSPDKVNSLACAMLDVDDDMFTDSGHIPYVDGTNVLVDIMKLTDIGLKYDIIPLQFLMKDMKNWDGLYCKNVDFKEVENTIDNKLLLGLLKPKDCIFENCNFAGLKNILISFDDNTFINCVLDK